MHSNVRKILLGMTIIIVMGVLGWLTLIRTGPVQNPDEPVINEVTFLCAEDQSIHAIFKKNSVELTLSDGREFTLDHVIAASGARYANQEESVVFWNKGNTAFMVEKDSLTYRNCVEKGEDDLSNLEAFRNKDDHIVFRYPRVFQQYRASVNDTAGWSYESTKRGQLVVQLKLPESFQPKTNFSAAMFTVGWNDRPEVLKSCMEAPRAAVLQTATVTQNGNTYSRCRYGEAGAGNFYHVTRYRTVKNNRCYSIEEMVHSTNIHNYPPERGISEFDSARVQKVLNTAFATFSFTDN